MTNPKRPSAALQLLSVREVQTASDGDHPDGGGLLIRVRGDSSSWVLRYTSPSGRRREMGLGIARRASASQAGESLTAARKLARDARDLLLTGLDPIDERDRKRAAARQAEAETKVQKVREKLTLARAARAYHERVVEPRLSAKHAAQWMTSLENHMPPEIWNAPISDITPPALLKALSRVRALDAPRTHVPETLQRMRQRLDAVFEDAIFHGHCTTNPAAAIRRKMREALPTTKAGKFKALPYAEASAFMADLREAPGTAARCLEFAILTASRTTEALTMEWKELDFEAAVWVIPAHKMKVKETHTVYLSPAAIELLKRQRGQDLALVFPSIVLEGQPMSNMAMLTVLDRMGMRERTTVHGLCRATFSTWANDTAAARPEVIEACLAHQESDRVKAAYNRAEHIEARRALMNAWSVYLAAPKGKVLQLHAA
jgi:integrase